MLSPCLNPRKAEGLLLDQAPDSIDDAQRAELLVLERFPAAQVNRSLQAWDSGDEYLLKTLVEQSLITPTTDAKKIAIFNDSFGALCCALSQQQVTFISDSYVATQGCKANLANNLLSQDNIEFCNSIEMPADKVDLVLVKLPKIKAHFHYQLQQIHRLCHDGTQIIIAGKAKEIHTSTLKLVEQQLGDCQTSLAWKKSRLIFVNRNVKLQAPLPELKQWQLNESGMPSLTISNHSNVFSRDSLDIGARFMMQHLPKVKTGSKVADLGCGNGVLGLALLQQQPDIKLHFFDESYMAVASAKINVEQNFPQQLSHCQFHWNDCLSQVEASSLDLVLCNPPFHQQQAVTDHIAWQMFQDCYQVLDSGGEVRIIGNRQLGYHVKLKRLFGNARVVSSNKKFVVLSAVKL
ncbi:methyltransferase [Thalassotalea mangrovi]|uniref:Ribosomal RNA large subunit methyltransferase G n=1 Tax=Thalassotalea mangrovi TaxID=2572245 RepID=A0A4U1B3P4_9GAMM|nr:methyltransferase [Thalassotalea mangrovi]TKB44629.1 methyltransferase domain-containing protein [Thalassotalea mangrovi]